MTSISKGSSHSNKSAPHSSSSDPFLSRGFSKIDDDYAFLLECFKEVLEEIGHPRIAKVLSPNSGNGNRPLNQESVQALSIAFQLLNLVEENTANQIARQRFSKAGKKAASGSWRQQIQTLPKGPKLKGLLKQLLAQTEVQIVLTAHPTESKKWSILDQHRELYVNLFQLENSLYTQSERELFRAEIKNTLERLWRTGEIPSRKPDIIAERQNVLYYLGEKFPEAVRLHDLRLKQTLASDNDQSNDSLNYRQLPKLEFGTWVGGDRDGHPFVTSEITAETLHVLRQRALELAQTSLSRLSQRLPLSNQSQSPTPKLTRRLAELRESASPRPSNPFPDEPWRAFVNHLAKRLPELNEPQDSGSYRRPSELQADLEILADSLRKVKANRLIESELAPLQRELDIFGFHLAKLDIRQNSGYLEKAFVQLLQGSYPEEAKTFTDWAEEDKVQFLNQELATSRPLTNQFAALGPEATEILKVLRVCLSEIRQHGRAGLGSFIVSMTRQLSDLLIVYILCREAGLVVNHQGSMACLLPVVPLLETEDDLIRGTSILDAFLSHKVTQSSQPIWNRALDNDMDDAWLRKPLVPRRAPRPRQQVMLGYSDSNKDCGIMASLWAVRRAQIHLQQVGTRHGVDLQFFHGRGGTISRGAGPTHRFLNALPGQTVAGGLRLTEQGETIGQKYSNSLTASHNLELLLAGSLACGGRKVNSDAKVHWGKTMDFLSQWSSAAYQSLIQTPGFQDFFQQATPIDVLQNSRIGSRPAARTGKPTIQDMRAIPWTFGWNQARFYLPGWFGAGSALERLHNEHRDRFNRLSKEIQQTPFLSYLFFNLEASLESADVEIMADYAGLVQDRQTRQKFLTMILQEHQRTHQWLQTLLKTPIKSRRPRFYRTLHARDQGLRRLHSHQIRLLKKWRKNKSDATLNELLVVVNAIASGQRTTG